MCKPPEYQATSGAAFTNVNYSVVRLKHGQFSPKSSHEGELWDVFCEFNLLIKFWPNPRSAKYNMFY